MKITIRGAGLAGLATAQLAKRLGHEVNVLYEGLSASNVGAGLLHPYGGVRAKLNRLGLEGMKAALELIPEHVILQKGILRLAVDQQLQTHFRATGMPWVTQEEVVRRNPGAAPFPGIWIEEGYVIDMRAYLDHLSLGLDIRQNGEEPSDLTIWAIGAYCEEVNKVKGQTLYLKMKNHGIFETINSHCYVIPQREGLLVGATFERDTADWEPDVAKAKMLLFPKLKTLMPQLDESTIESIECKAGVRAATSDHMPLIKQLDAKNWLFTGLGSKGLLYHALFAKILLNTLKE